MNKQLRFMPETIGDQAKLSRQRQSWMIAVVFAGMGTGFIAFWVTLSMLNSSALSAIISLFVWPISRDKVGRDFATKATILFFAATIIGILVGFASSIGSGLPLSGL